MTEPAGSVRFQANSSVLTGSAPAANYKPTRPQLTQETSHPANPGRVRSSPDIESNFSLMPAQRGGAETEMVAGCNRRELDAPLGVFYSGLMYGSLLFPKRASVALPN